EGELTGGAGDGAALGWHEGQRVAAGEVGAVDGHRLVAAQCRVRGRGDRADGGCHRRGGHCEVHRAGVQGTIRTVDLDSPGADIAGVVELVAELAAAHEGELTGG